MTATLQPVRPAPSDGAHPTAEALVDRFEELRLSLRPTWETAVDATDIAVMLEAGGINDGIASTTYAARDTHELARRLLASVPTRAIVTAALHENHTRAPGTSARLIARGLLYAAPGTFYVAAAADFGSQWAGLTVLGATVTGWMLSQVIGIFAHRLTVRTGAANTHAVLRKCVAGAILVGAALGIANQPLVGYFAATVLAAQVIFASAAAVLLFYQSDRALAVCVVPGALLAGGCAFLPNAAWPPWLASCIAAAAAMMSALAAAVAAWTSPGTTETTGTRAAVQFPTAREVTMTVPYILYGILCATALASGPMIDMVNDAFGHGATGSGFVVLPVVLVMGYAELEIRKLRASCQAIAAMSTTIRRYRRRARADLLRMEARLAAALVLTTAATTASIWAISGGNNIPGDRVVQSAGYLALGCALVAGLVGCAFARPMETVTTMLLAFVVIGFASCVLTRFTLSSPPDFLAACLFVLVAVNFAAIRIVDDPVAVLG